MTGKKLLCKHEMQTNRQSPQCVINCVTQLVLHIFYFAKLRKIKKLSTKAHDKNENILSIDYFSTFTRMMVNDMGANSYSNCLPNLPKRVALSPDAATHLHEFTVMVLSRFAFVVENHGDTCLLVVGFPLGQSLRVGIARLDE